MMSEGSDKKEVREKTGVSVALWDINLKIPRGQIFVIIGLSGSGKSTLVRCFNQLNRPTSGKVLFDGKDLAGALQEGAAGVPQEQDFHGVPVLRPHEPPGRAGKCGLRPGGQGHFPGGAGEEGHGSHRDGGA